MNEIVKKEHAERIWDSLAQDSFEPAKLRQVLVDGTAFQVLHLPRREEFKPGVYLETGLSFLAWPRLAGYRCRFVLVPKDTLAGPPRWEIRCQDVADWMLWSSHMQHVVTLSTFKSGASYPFEVHAQSFPLRRDHDNLSALVNLGARLLVRFGSMPHFEELQIEALEGYPARGIVIRSHHTDAGRRQAAQKAYELALNYDGLKAFNLVIVPGEEDSPSVFVFPRPKDGRAIYGPRRWQIAAVELNGLLQAKDPNEAASIDSDTIKEIFRQTTLSERQFEEFCKGIDTF